MKKNLYDLLFLIFFLLILNSFLIINICSAHFIQMNTPRGDDVRCLTISVTNIFAGTEEGGVFRSTNNGESWIQTSLNFYEVRSLCVSGNNIFVGTNLGVFLTTNDGESWTDVNNGSYYDLERVNVLASSGNYVLAGTDLGVFLTTNNGKTWSQSGLSTIWSLAIYGGCIFAGTSDEGIFFSTDKCKSWTRSVPYKYVNALAVNLGVEGINIFAGIFTNKGGVYVSNNSGWYWNFHCFEDGVSSLTISGTNIFAGTSESGIFLSTDEGRSWSTVNNGLLNKQVLCLASKENNIFAGTYGGGVFLSTNNGKSWTEVNNGLMY